MISGLLKLSTLSLALLSTQAIAVGFGEITLHSRIGEALRAEVPILLSTGETLDGACFNLAPLDGADLPVVSSARTKLLREGRNYRLLITGSKAIAEPLFIIGLRAGCGFDLQRDYVLMPGEPLTAVDAIDWPTQTKHEPTSAPSRKSYREWQASDGDTLESIAETLAPDDMVRQRRLLSALKRANPGLHAEQMLSTGDSVRIPNRRSAAPAERETIARSRQGNRPEAPPPPVKTAGAQSAGQGDRIVLGAPPEDLSLRPNQPPPRGSMADMDERMLKLETTLHQLNQEVDKLNKVLELTAETMVAQQKLQMAQAMQQHPPSESAIAHATPPAPDDTARSNWLELLFSALVGGTIAAGTAHLLSRRRERRPSLAELATIEPRSSQPPIATAAAQEPQEGKQDIFSLGLPPVEMPMPAATVDIPLETNFPASDVAGEMAVEFNETASALELAEIMLSFGRIKGAADTLAQHIEQNAPNNVQPWSMLLDLYRRAGMRPEFDRLAQRTREKFNLQIPTWDDSTTPVSGLKSLEDYAHITWRLVSQWGTQEVMDYLYDLIHDSRAGQRFGFPLEIVEEIALLMRLLETGYGLKRPD